MRRRRHHGQPGRALECLDHIYSPTVKVDDERPLAGLTWVELSEATVSEWLQMTLSGRPSAKFTARQ